MDKIESKEVMLSNMKRFVFTIIFLLQLVSPLKATPNKQDSLRVFSEQIGEDTTIISLLLMAHI